MRKMTRFIGRFCLLGALLLVVFLGGGRRLIAGGETETAQRVTPVDSLSAALCSPPAQQTSSPSLLKARRDAESPERICGLSAQAAVAQPLRGVDANGNVLTHRNYLHALYQVFALGDGFV